MTSCEQYYTKIGLSKTVMKRYGQLFEKVCSIENIENAIDKVLKHSNQKKAKKYLIDHREEIVKQIHYQLQTETYRFSSLREFIVYEPKERVIHCPSKIQDKVVHHCLMNICTPLFYKKFTRDSYGCIKGRGIVTANKRIAKTLKTLPNYYFLQIDIKKCYASIDHNILKNILRNTFKDKKVLNLFNKIIDVMDKGLAIGVYPSQSLENLYLNDVDHYIKEVLKVQYYFRYVDDLLFILPNKQSCWDIYYKVKQQIEKLNLTIKPNFRIAPVTYGIDIIGYKFYPGYTLLRKRIKLNFIKKVNKCWKLSDKDFKQQIASYYGWCKWCDSKNLLKTVLKDRYLLFSA